MANLGWTTVQYIRDQRIESILAGLGPVCFHELAVFQKMVG